MARPTSSKSTRLFRGEGKAASGKTEQNGEDVTPLSQRESENFDFLIVPQAETCEWSTRIAASVKKIYAVLVCSTAFPAFMSTVFVLRLSWQETMTVLSF